MRWLLVVALGGCGFHSLPHDLGARDLAGAGSQDMAGADLAGADLSTGNGPTGPGPLGALPTGFCCSSNEECRSRNCAAAGGGPAVCLDECASDALCTAWSSDFHCDTSGGFCAPNGARSTCLDPSGYHYGSKSIGACCANGFVKSGQECAGGLCEATGNDANPFYCTQGCDAASPCPSNYTCASGFCWIVQSFTDPNFIYTCQ